MPQVITGFEPSGGQSLFSQGWRLTAQQVFNKDPAGTDAVATYQDAQIISLTGIDLWPAMTVGQLYSVFAGKGLRVYYISLWRNPPAILGTGVDYFRAITVSKVT